MPSKTNLGEKSTPRVWITTSMSGSTFRIVPGSSALPDTLVRFAFWIGMPAPERAKARTLWPARSAALAVSSPIPRLAPMMRTLAIILPTHICFRVGVGKQVNGVLPDERKAWRHIFDLV